jgi:hypothetical protein
LGGLLVYRRVEDGAMTKKNIVKKGQSWRNKATGKVVRVKGKATGNRHWSIDNGHHIHEGTLLKYYERVIKGGIER